MPNTKPPKEPLTSVEIGLKIARRQEKARSFWAKYKRKTSRIKRNIADAHKRG